MSRIEPRPLVPGIAWVLLPLVLAQPGAVVCGGEGNPNRAAMADAMSRMMESMGLMGAGTDAAKSMAGGGVPGLPLGQAGEAGKRMLEGNDQRCGRHRRGIGGGVGGGRGRAPDRPGRPLPDLCAELVSRRRQATDRR